METNQQIEAVTVTRTFTTVVADCPKCHDEYTARSPERLGRTCGRIMCEAYADSPHMVLEEDGWHDTRP